MMESTEFGYKCIQTYFPAKLLYNLYEKYNTRLLYNNVRYYLGLKGSKDKKPNVAMLETLRNENEMFLAYNNGITALANGIEAEMLGDKQDITNPEDKNQASQYISMGYIRKICDFRIINGGQTTATIFAGRNYNKGTSSSNVNLRGVFVQVKLIISDKIETLAGKIAKSSNFQNKVSLSDFSVGNPFNTTLESLSRSIDVPNTNNDHTFWFYERLKGQYDESKKSIHAKYDKELFESKFPPKKKFTKEDVAKVWCSWDGFPYDAVKGASTAYGAFMKRIDDRKLIPDNVFYKKTVALIIIYRFLLSRPENKLYANAKATVVAYTLAMLSYSTANLFDLIKVWENQNLSNNTKIYLNALSDKIFSHIEEKAKELNTSVLSYGKTKLAYEDLYKSIFVSESSLLKDELIES